MAASNTKVSMDVLNLDCPKAADDLCASIVASARRFKKKGIVVGISGGIDSSCVAAASVKALGAKRVRLLLMPEGESHSTDESTQLGRALADAVGVEPVMENLTPILEGARCYQRRDAAIQEVIPEYGEGWKSKIVLPSVVDSDQYRMFSIVAQSPDGEIVKKRLRPASYLGVVAATNFKQRTRKMMEYYHADCLNYLVAGTPNRLEYDQGFFVKGGDGLADVKPIAHLYKTQVYQLSAHLGVPEEILVRPPTTDTYSLPQSQEEFYFSLSYEKMDLCLWGKNNGVTPAEIGEVLGYTEEQILRVYNDIDHKRAFAEYLRAPAVLVEDVPEI